MLQLSVYCTKRTIPEIKRLMKRILIEVYLAH